MTQDAVLPLPSRNKGPVSAVLLAGFMGAGKTTVGQALAARLGWTFSDLDRMIELREGRLISQIFAVSGEPGFRHIEHECLTEALESLRTGQCVFALGGGALTPENQRLLASAGVAVVFLDAPVEELFRRCEQPGVIRPLRRDLNQFRELYEARLPSYANSSLKVPTCGKDISLIVEEIISGLSLVRISGASE